MKYQKIINLIDNIVTDVAAKLYDARITKVSQNSGTVTNENDKEIPKENYIFPEERQKVINNLIFNIIV